MEHRLRDILDVAIRRASVDLSPRYAKRASNGAFLTQFRRGREARGPFGNYPIKSLSTPHSASANG